MIFGIVMTFREMLKISMIYNLFSEISIVKGWMEENMFRKYFEEICGRAK